MGINFRYLHSCSHNPCEWSESWIIEKHQKSQPGNFKMDSFVAGKNFSKVKFSRRKISNFVKKLNLKLEKLKQNISACWPDPKCFKNELLFSLSHGSANSNTSCSKSVLWAGITDQITSHDSVDHTYTILNGVSWDSHNSSVKGRQEPSELQTREDEIVMWENAL